MRNENYDFNRRLGRFDNDMIAGMRIPWCEEIVSVNGANYHCWISKLLTKKEQKETFDKFKRAARTKGDPVSFSWDYLPEEK
jgi:hypothetical protein